MKVKTSLIKQEAEVEATENEIKAFFNGVVPDFVKQTGGILSDTVRFWRWKNQVAIVLKAKKVLEEKGLNKQAVSLKVLVPLIDASSLEEDKSMQAKWANLLANAISGVMEIKPNYVAILKELSPVEVLVLDKLYDAVIVETDLKKRFLMQFSKEKIVEWLKLGEDTTNLLIENLFRLNLCRMPGSTGMTFGENMRVAVITTDVFEITATGFDFVRACRTPQKI